MINEKGQFVKGHISTCGFKKGSSGFTGKHSEESKKKMSEAASGRKAWNKGLNKKTNPSLSRSGVKKGNNPWNKNKPYLAIRGEKHPNWKGGATKENQKIRHSLEYKLWRIAVFERDNYTCIWCGKKSKGNLNADHIKSFADFPELRFAIDNGRTLCVPCHKTTENYLWKAQALKRKST